MFPYFTVFGKEIGLYGICAAAGIIITSLVATYLAKKRGIVFEDLLFAILIALGSGFILTHIFFGITNIGQIIELTKRFNELGFINYIKELYIYFSGMVFYGGLIGAAIGIYIFSKSYKPLKDKTKEILDIFSVSFPLFHAFGRVGCFFAGCCYGCESDFGFTITNNTLNPDINGVNRLPVQLIESFCCILIFITLLTLFNKGNCKGNLLYVYMIIYGIVRFTDEFFRGDVIRGFLLDLSTSQWISIILVVFSIVMLIIKGIKKKKVKVE